MDGGGGGLLQFFFAEDVSSPYHPKSPSKMSFFENISTAKFGDFSEGPMDPRKGSTLKPILDCFRFAEKDDCTKK